MHSERMQNQQRHAAALAKVVLDLELLLCETQMHILPTGSASLAQHSLSKLHSKATLLNLILVNHFFCVLLYDIHFHNNNNNQLKVKPSFWSVFFAYHINVNSFTF